MTTHLIGWQGSQPNDELYMIRATPVFQAWSTVFQEEPEEAYWLGDKRISREEFEVLSIVKMPGRNFVTVVGFDSSCGVNSILVTDREAPKCFHRPEASCVHDIRFSLYVSESDAEKAIEEMASNMLESGITDPKALHTIAVLQVAAK